MDDTPLLEAVCMHARRILKPYNTNITSEAFGPLPLPLLFTFTLVALMKPSQQVRKGVQIKVVCVLSTGNNYI